MNRSTRSAELGVAVELGVDVDVAEVEVVAEAGLPEEVEKQGLAGRLHRSPSQHLPRLDQQTGRLLLTRQRVQNGISGGSL